MWYILGVYLMSMDNHLVSLGFTPEEFPAGTHMCYIYNDDKEKNSIISKFIESAVANNEQMHYFRYGPKGETLEEARRSLGTQLPEDGASGRFKISRALDAYCPDGVFVPERTIKQISEAYLSSIKNGYAGARFTSEMMWSLEKAPGSERLVEYEAYVSQVVAQYPLTAICQYDARQFDGATLFDVLAVHPAMIVHGQVVRNPYYIPPEKFLASRRACACACA